MNDSAIYHVTFLRHGESVGNAEDRFQGQADFLLTERGITQARLLSERWAAAGRSFDLCIASPLLRARQTAEIITGALDLPIEFAPDWMEVQNGKLAGLKDDEASFMVPRPKFMTPYMHWGETGESRLELLLRAGKAIQNLLDRQPGKYLVVAHGGILNMALFTVMNITLHADSQGPRFIFGNTGFADLTYEPARHSWRLWALDNTIDRENDG